MITNSLSGVEECGEGKKVVSKGVGEWVVWRVLEKEVLFGCGGGWKGRVGLVSVM